MIQEGDRAKKAFVKIYILIAWSPRSGYFSSFQQFPRPCFVYSVTDNDVTGKRHTGKGLAIIHKGGQAYPPVNRTKSDIGMTGEGGQQFRKKYSALRYAQEKRQHRNVFSILKSHCILFILSFVLIGAAAYLYHPFSVFHRNFGFSVWMSNVTQSI